MKGKLFWIGMVFILMLTIFMVTGSASQGGGFEGAWSATDLDGSNEWLWITDHYDAYEIILYDDMCSTCVGSSGEEAPSCLVLGSAQLADADTLRMDGGTLYCYWLEGVEKFAWNFDGNATDYDSTTDTLQGFLVEWQRSNDKKEEKIIDPIRVPKVCVPSLEVCDGIDNDCNGEIDESLVRTCSSGGIGVCTAGTQTCEDGLWRACVGDVLSSPELCDLLDNDCDGDTDEDFLDVGTQCLAGEGLCERQGFYMCSADGQGTICDAIPGPPETEVCDGIDNDCDALVDEGGVCEGLCFYIGGGLYQADNCIYEDSTCSSTPLSCEG